MERIDHAEQMMDRLDRITHEIAEIKAALIHQVRPETDETEAAWNDLMEVSKDVSRLWKGPSALEEIRAQRER